MEKYRSIQIGRAIAALAVVLVHTTSVANDVSHHEAGLPQWVAASLPGVDIFFVISGFIIPLVIARGEDSAGLFLARRIIRIIPFYAAFSLIWASLAYFAGHPLGDRSLASSLLLIPQTEYPILGVGWTLEQEFVFYGIVALLLLTRQLRVLPITLILLPLLGLALGSAGLKFWDYRIFSLFHFEFFLGVMLFRFRGVIIHTSPIVCLLAAIGLFIASGFLLNQLYPDGHLGVIPEGFPGVIRVLCYGSASATLLCGLIAFERQYRKAMENRLLRFLESVGDSSYALYLSHPIVFAVFGVVLGQFALPESLAWPAIITAIGLAIVGALIWFRLVERPFLRWVRPFTTLGSHTRPEGK